MIRFTLACTTGSQCSTVIKKLSHALHFIRYVLFLGLMALINTYSGNVKLYAPPTSYMNGID